MSVNGQGEKGQYKIEYRPRKARRRTPQGTQKGSVPNVLDSAPSDATYMRYMDREGVRRLLLPEFDASTKFGRIEELTDAYIALDELEAVSKCEPLRIISAHCNCIKSKCLLLYCECFGEDLLCGATCKCKDCANTSYSGKRNRAATNKTLSRPVGERPTICKCKKSNCQKKYCECYHAGRACSDKCKCADCANKTAKECELELD